MRNGYACKTWIRSRKRRIFKHICMQEFDNWRFVLHTSVLRSCFQVINRALKTVMKNTIIPALFALALSLPCMAAPAVWQLDPPHSAAQFAVRHMGISTVRGTFTKLSGTAHYDPANVQNDSVDVTIDAASVDSRVEMRDNDLRSDHFFDVQKYPTITFKSTKVESAGTDKLKIIGDLTIHGITKPVALDMDGPLKP